MKIGISFARTLVLGSRTAEPTAIGLESSAIVVVSLFSRFLAAFARSSASYRTPTTPTDVRNSVKVEDWDKEFCLYS